MAATPETTEKAEGTKKTFFNDPDARRAFLFGVTHDGFKVWDRKAITYDEINEMKTISPELRQILKTYHDTWYTYGVDTPEFVALIGLFLYFVRTGGIEAAVKTIAGLAGIPL